MKKFSTLLLMFCLCLSVIGCSSSSKPQSGVDDYFKAIKECNTEKIQAALYREKEEKASDSKLYEDETYKEIFSKNAEVIKYKITDTSINGDEATVKVNCTYGDASEIFGTALKSYMGKVFQAAFSTQKMSDEETKKLLNDEIKAASKDNKIKTITSDVDIKCKKVDGKWLVVSDENSANIATANIVKTFTDLAKSFADTANK